ncbi:MAG: efflux RND transporter periplasmic adaptor subunit [Bdellovibrionales bacterium]
MFGIESREHRRKRLFLLFGGILVAVFLVGSLYWYAFLAGTISTDNAYVAAEVAQITPSIDGTIKEVNVTDTQSVKTGDVLVVIDDIDARLDRERAKGLLAKSQTDLDRAKIDLDRRKALASSGSIAAEELTNAENAYRVAKAAFDTAKAVMEKADVDLERTVIHSPIDGVIVKREVQLGQKVHAGAPLMSIVPLSKVYVNANFKENKLREVKSGQPAELISDLYGDDVVYHGRVIGLSGGTGAAFSLIPAQNATGNWIKVVQRLPVRIELDPKELEAHPLQVGLSMDVTIDTKAR